MFLRNEVWISEGRVLIRKKKIIIIEGRVAEEKEDRGQVGEKINVNHIRFI